MNQALRVVVSGLLLGVTSIVVRAQDRDPKADAIGHELIDALGGQSAWEKARQFQFDFVVEREGKRVASFSHVWDRYTGDYRLTGTEKTGAPYVVYFNVNTRQGRALLNGKPAEGEALANLLTTAYGRFINDTYWLLAPWKIFDPGVHRAYEGEKPCPEGGTCDVLKLSFENVGLTPRDLYWLYVTHDERRVVQWQYVLNGTQDEPTTALWKHWQKFSGVSLSLEKEIVGKNATLRIERVSVSPTRDDSLFRPPAS